jgi:tetratricopeptide (TPR) repeat protein
MEDQLQCIVRALAGQYAVQRELGRGGAATVYLAEDLRHGRMVAVKVLHPGLSPSISADRFRREIAIAARLNHPHIVAVFDSGEADGLLYYVMPFVEGMTLRDEMDRLGALPLARALRIARDVADGLEYAHGAGVVHRDIKPRNILLSARHAQITDFGIARALQLAAGSDLTTAGLVMGTPAYMSPEQAAGDEPIDARSDVYALGCVVYEMLAGEAPFRARSTQGLLSQHLVRAPPSLADARPDVPVEVSEAVRRALAKSPDDRFPSVTDFIAQLEEADGAGRDTIVSALRRVRRRIARMPWSVGAPLALTALFFVVATVVLTRRMVPTTVAWAGERPATIVVLPYHSLSSTEEERLVTIDIAAEITGEIDVWETIRAVPHVALGGPMFDLGITGPTVGRIDDGARIAREFDVQAFLAVTVRLRGDTATVEASLFDARSGREVGQPFRARGSPRSDVLARSIAAAIVGVSDVLGDAPDRQSANPHALIADARGRAQLERWRLHEAEQSFRTAVEADSTFAMARHRLAQTLYWQASAAGGLTERLDGEIAFHSAAALRHSANLSTRDSLHLRAFYAFQEDDHESARRAYQRLVQLDANDVYAWLLLGSVEYLDPWLNDNSESARPRASYNVAIHAVAEALRLQPTFELGYGHLFDIYREMTSAIDVSACPTFLVPAGERRVHADGPSRQQMPSFCPVRLDSIVWLTRAELDSLGTPAAAAGADSLFRESLDLLRRWVKYSPDQPKPATELARQILAQRSRLRIAPPERIDSLASEALAHARKALQLSTDSTPIDLIRIGTLYLGVDSVEHGVALVEQGLARHAARGGDPNDPGLALAANAFAATGRPGRAMLFPLATGRSRFVPDTATGTMIPYGGAEPVIERLRLLGATQTAGVALRDELRQLEQIWTTPAYTRAQLRVLRREAALRIASALMLDTAALTRWNDDLGLDDPLWQAILLASSAPVAARAALERSQSTPTLTLGEASRTFLHGLVATNLGDHTAAIAAFTRLDSIPFALDRIDVNWGLRWTGRLRRAGSHMALGNRRLALYDFESFIQAWSGADSLAAPLVEYARNQAASLREGR